LGTKEAASPRAVIGSTLIRGCIKVAHGWTIRSLAVASLVLQGRTGWRPAAAAGPAQVAGAQNVPVGRRHTAPPPHFP
jgi:hypothetical protein